LQVFNDEILLFDIIIYYFMTLKYNEKKLKS